MKIAFNFKMSASHERKGGQAPKIHHPSMIYLLPYRTFIFSLGIPLKLEGGINH